MGESTKRLTKLMRHERIYQNKRTNWKAKTSFNSLPGSFSHWIDPIRRLVFKQFGIDLRRSKKNNIEVIISAEDVEKTDRVIGDI